MQILLVDDDDFALAVLESALGRMGFTTVAAHDGREALEILRRGEIRLVVTDWNMPVMNGIDLCRAIRREDLAYVYVIMLTGREGAQQRMEGLCAGADDFLNKPLDPEELLVCLKTAERILSLEPHDLALFALAKLAESRDSEAGAHVERVQAYTRIIARNLSADTKAHHGVDDQYVQLLYQTSPLHDLGKVGIPDTVLLKPGKLTPEEFSIMKTHAVIGAQTLDSALARFPNARFLRMARDIALSHHEKFDGSGYPAGLAGEQIPFCGRIVAVADVYDALTSRRVYKEALPHEEAKRIILDSRGSHFDPEVVDAFLRAELQIVAAWERLRDDEVPAAKLAALPLPLVPEQRSPSPSTILVVDDDPIVLKKLRELLEATGETVSQASNGEEALKLVALNDPKVVVSDWLMPGIDGVEFCRRIRARQNAKPPHFIMLTVHSDKSRLLAAYHAGVDDFIAKPFDPEELLARVRAGLRAAKLHDELARRASGSEALNGQLAVMNSRLERLSVTDELTGLFNRRHAMLRLEEQWELAERCDKPLTIAMADIDHFKQINDTYGHGAGDVILRRIGAILRDESRGEDTICRVGGEEFLILYPSLTLQEACVSAERCRAAVAAQSFAVHGALISVTISIGVASRVVGMAQFPDLLQLADEALYAAKQAGRNLVRSMERTPQRPNLTNPSTPALTSEDQDCSPGPPVDMNAVLKRCGGDSQFAAAIAQRFQNQAGSEVDRVEQALAGHDPEALCRAAHNLKSMTAYMGADAASALANQIEDLGRDNRLTDVPPVLVQLRDQVERTIAWISQDSSAAHRA